jgi:CheY-like chemotaxis protein
MAPLILIAEDNPAVRTALRTVLVAAGSWEVVEAANGQEAIAKAQELKPNLIILDLVMPLMDGLKAARQLSQLVPSIPVLMHTMHWSPQVELEAQKVGIKKVVSKTDTRLLISTVQEILSASPTAHEPESSTLSTDIPIPTATPPPPVLETTSAKPADNAVESSLATGDLPPTSQPN